ncbi:MAG TPA: arginase family protein [Trebonia sp.]|nr:arginase family protein [Trebonia sp.]
MTADTARRVIVLGAATSAGTHHAGQERAPDALRAAGFTDALTAAGLLVHDAGNVAGEVFRPDRSGAPARNAAATARVARAVADAVARHAAPDTVLIVLGGDCSITLGVLAGLQRAEPDAGLVYFDGDADLGRPRADLGSAGDDNGILDAMGIAHLLGLADTELTQLFRTRPPIDERRLAMLGYEVTQPDPFREAVFADRPGLSRSPDHAVRADPAGAARRALRAVAGAGRLVVHFDVDAVDSGDLPLANFPHYGTGVTLDAAREVLSVLFAAPALAAVVLTEVNPSYDPSGESLRRYVDVVTGTLAAGLGQS